MVVIFRNSAAHSTTSDDIFEFLTEVKRKIEIDEQDEDKLIQELEIKI